MYKYLLHVSDLHFTKRDRYEEYTDVFEKLLIEIEKYGEETLLVITGDIFNEKTTLETKQIEFSRYYINEICKRIKVIAIAGNHDFQAQDRKRPDSISTSLYGLDFTYIKNTCYTQIGNIVFGHLSIFDILNQTTSGLRIPFVDFPCGDKISDEFHKVALIHTTFNRCTFQSTSDKGREIQEENKFDLYPFEKIRGYDLILAGDCHQMQFIDKIAGYPSSLLQQNRGEHPLNHGYILWDLENKSGEFHRICAKFAKVKLHPYYGKKTQKLHSVKIEGFPETLTKKDIDSIDKHQLPTHLDILIESKKSDRPSLTIMNEVKEFMKKLNFTITNINVRYKLKSEKKVVEEQKVLDPLDLETMKFFLSKENQSNLFDKLKKSYLECSISSRPTNIVNWKLKNMKWENLLSYEKGEIDFDKDGLTLLNGENFSGKSSVIDILVFAIYKQGVRFTTISNILNVNKTSGSVKLNFEAFGKKYEIVRNVKTKGQKTDYYEIDDDKKIKFHPVDENFMKDIFGSKEEFLSIYVQDQDNKFNFITSDRKKILDSWLRLSELKDLSKKLDEKCEDAKKEFIQTETKYKLLEQQLPKKVSLDEEMNRFFEVLDGF